MNEFLFDELGVYYRTNEFHKEKETLVFIHGVSGSSSAWVEYEKKFGEDYNILTYDLRGHGKSYKKKNYSDYSIKNFSDDLARLLSHLNIDEFVMISHSFASLIALEFLSSHKGRVKKAIFLSPSFSTKEQFVSRLVDPLLFLYRGLVAFFPRSDKPGRHIDYSLYLNSGDWNIPRMIADVSNTTLRVYLYCSQQAIRVNYKELLPLIKIPVLTVHGKKDTIFPYSNSVRMNEVIKCSKLVLLPKANHILVLNNFDEVSGAMEDFLKEDKTDAPRIIV